MLFFGISKSKKEQADFYVSEVFMGQIDSVMKHVPVCRELDRYDK